MSLLIVGTEVSTRMRRGLRRKSTYQRSSRNFACHYGSPMNSQCRGESWAAELPDDIDDPRVVGSLPDEPTQV